MGDLRLCNDFSSVGSMGLLVTEILGRVIVRGTRKVETFYAEPQSWGAFIQPGTEGMVYSTSGKKRERQADLTDILEGENRENAIELGDLKDGVVGSSDSQHCKDEKEGDVEHQQSQ